MLEVYGLAADASMAELEAAVEKADRGRLPAVVRCAAAAAMVQLQPRPSQLHGKMRHGSLPWKQLQENVLVLKESKQLTCPFERSP